MKLPTVRQYPKTVKVADEIYKIKFVRKVPGQDENTMGLCDPETRVISIKLGQSVTETFNTFIHEVLHAFEYEYDLEVPHKLIYAFERALSDFLLTNF